ncbi:MULTISPECIES: hypothetical protein [Saccharothrix]|uniref:hypothetical protein n=1 Tax=Saccharothrix TaxID=2071 RepID=UPI00093E2031|nr:hypothetical protein [Saccharothrix sp. CB00851]OKI26372.1 hypothetical protein A6A25_32320 [Saccharothrix sp. CB00851]
MKRTTPALLALAAVLLVGACGGGTTTAASSSSAGTTSSTTPSVDAAAEEEAIRQAFADYRDAARAKDGAAAAKVLSQDSLDYYREMRDLSLTGTAEQLGDQGTTTMMMVYVMRAEFDATELRGMSAEQLVAAAVEKGLVSESSLDNVDLGTMTVDGETATAKMTVSGKPAGIEMTFRKEDGSWRFDAHSIMAAVDESLKAVAKQQGLSMEEFIDTALGSLYGADRVPELKKPLEG